MVEGPTSTVLMKTPRPRTTARKSTRTEIISTTDGKEVLLSPREIGQILRYKNQPSEEELINQLWARELLPKGKASPEALNKAAKRETARVVIENHRFADGTSDLGKALGLMLREKNWKEITDACKNGRFYLERMISREIRKNGLGNELEDAGILHSDWKRLFGRAL